MKGQLQADEAKALLQASINGELPDERGRFGPFGGRYVPETLVPAFERLEQGVKDHLHDATFQQEFQRELREWVGRPTALTHAPRLSERWGTDVWLKREDLAHTGAHKINNAIGQAILAKRLGAKRVIAETGAGQHGVASAAACARVGLPCAVYMGAVDIERQAPNVDRMRRLGAEVVAVESGDKTLRAAIDEAFAIYTEREFVSEFSDIEKKVPGVYGFARRQWDEGQIFTRFVRKLYFPHKPLAGPGMRPSGGSDWMKNLGRR